MNLLISFYIAIASFKGFARDRIFYGILLFSLLIICFSFLLATLTIVEERKILLDFGFSAVSLSGIFVAIFIGVSTMAKEIENHTIYTVLSKPISRSTYLLGKLIGGAFVLFCVHLAISTTLMGTLLAWGQGFPSGILDCFLLMFLESLIVLAISLLFSVQSSGTFLAAVFSFSIFLIGRSNTTLQYLSTKIRAAPFRQCLRILYWLMPNLDRYNIRDVVAYNKPYPSSMISIGALYCILYICLCLTMSAWILRKKDLH